MKMHLIFTVHKICHCLILASASLDRACTKCVLRVNGKACICSRFGRRSQSALDRAFQGECYLDCSQEFGIKQRERVQGRRLAAQYEVNDGFPLTEALK